MRSSICVHLCSSVVSNLFVMIALFAGTTRADEQWILTTSDFKSETVSIRAIDDAGIHIPGAGGDERVLSMNQFLQLDRFGQLRAPPSKMFLWLTDGDRLGGSPQGISGESLLWRSPALGDL